MDSDSSGEDFKPTGRSKLGALFAKHDAAAKEGDPTFTWKPPKKKQQEREQEAPSPTAVVGEDVVLQKANCRLFVDQQLKAVTMGILRAKVAAEGQPPWVSLLFITQDKKKVLETQISSVTYWVQTPYDGQQQYVTFQDDQGRNWTAQFKTPSEATSFTQNLYVVQYSLSLLDGSHAPRTVFDLLGGTGDAMEDGDLVGVRCRYHRVTPYANCPSLLCLNPAPYEEADPKKIRIGEGAEMEGVELRLRGMCKGQQTFVMVPPSDTVCSATGKRHMSLGEEDTVAAFLDLQKVKKAQKEDPKTAGALVVAAPPEDQRNAAQPVLDVQPVQQEQPQNPPEPAPVPAPAPEPAPAAPAAPAGVPALDTNALLTTLLVKQLGGGLQQPQAQPASPSPPPGDAQLSDISRGIDRLMVQMGQLYQKMDHIDVSRKLEENNEKLEAMVRRAVGRSPSQGFDPLRQGIDREADQGTLFAEIEKRDKKIEELTENYHNALSAISSSKEETSSLKSDLQIQYETAMERLKEAQERHRLALLEADVKARQDKDYAVDRARKEGREEGFKEGFAEGEREALLKHVGGHPDEIFNQLQAAREENNTLQSEMISLQQKLQGERKQHDEQMQLLNQLVQKYEDREREVTLQKENEAAGAVIGLQKDEVGMMMAKALKRIMNNVYFRVEEDLKAEPQAQHDAFSVQAVLTVVTKVIKGSTKQAIAGFKQELEQVAPDPSPTAAALMAASAAEQYVAATDASVPPPPPPPPPGPVDSSPASPIPPAT